VPRWPTASVARTLLTDPRFSDAASSPRMRRRSRRSWTKCFGAQPMPTGTKSLERPASRRRVQTLPIHQRSAAAGERHRRPAWRASGGDLTSTISAPFAVAGVAKVPARRAPELGGASTTTRCWKGWGSTATQIDGLRVSGAIPKKRAESQLGDDHESETRSRTAGRLFGSRPQRRAASFR